MQDNMNIRSNSVGYIIGIYLVSIISFNGLIHARIHTAKFHRLSIENGLSNSYVTCILQDSKGFMWFGTQDGLNKYDGYNFTIYKHDPANTNSLSDSYIRSITEAKNGILWIGTDNGGLTKFDLVKEIFTHYKHEPDNPNSLIHNSIRVVYLDPESPENMLWIGTDGGGLDSFDPVKETFTHYIHDPSNSNSLSNNFIRAIHKDKTGNLWVGTLNGLNRFDKKNGEWTSYYHDPTDPNSISHSGIYSIIEDRDGLLWFGTLDGINQLKSKESGTFIHYQETEYPGFKGDDVQAMKEDDSGVIWVGTFHGVMRFDKKEKRFTNYQYDSGNPGSLSGNNVKSIFEDRSGLLWFGTRGGGISRLNHLSEQFLHYAHNPNNPNSLSHPGVRGIYEDREGILWVGGYGGLNKIDRPTNQFTHYRANDSSGHQLDTDLIYVIIGDKENDNVLWIGSEGGGLYKFYKNSGKTKHYRQYDMVIQDPDVDYILSSGFIFDLYQDKEDMLWIATDKGLDKLIPASTGLTSERAPGEIERYHKSTVKITRYRHDPNNKNSLSSDKTRVIYEDREGFLWIGTESHGLNRFDRKTGKFTRFLNDPEHPHSLSNNRIKSIYESQSRLNQKEGTLWIGTNGGGLNRFDRETETFSYYTEKDGLPNNVVYGILEDEKGNLWLSTNWGVSRFNPRTEEFRNYDVSDGLQSNEFNTASFYKSKDGEMFFGGINGLTAFFPDKIKDYEFIPPVVITDFQIFNKSVPIDEMVTGRSILQKLISSTDRLKLSYKDNVFSFEFAALSYAAPGKNKYAYRMEGFDKDWVYTDAKRRFATYTHLDPGDYVFRVKGSNQDGIWNEQSTAIKISITPPPWKTWWAYTLYLIALASSVFGYVHYKTRQQEEELKRERETVENLRRIAALKAEALKSQEKYRTIVENAHDLIWMTDTKGRITFANQRCLEVIGYELGTIIGKKSVDLIHPEDRVKVQEDFFQKVVSRKEVQTLEIRIRDKKGDCVTLLVTGVPIIENSDIVGVMVFGLDITKRKQAEETLAEKSMYLDNILSSATEYAIATTDLDFRITYYNPMAEKIHGYKADEVIGKTVQEMHTMEKVAPERFDEAVKNILRNGEHCYIVKKETDEGTRYFDTRVSGIYNTEGEMVGFANFARDITERKLVEEKIQKLIRAVEQGSSMVIITDINGNIEYVNPRFTEITGFSLKEVNGKTPRFLKSGEQSSEVYKHLWATIKDGKEWRGEFHNKKKNGELYWVFCSISPIRDPGGKITHFVGIEEDITGRKQAEEEIRRMNRGLESAGESVVMTDLEGTIQYVNPAFTKLTGYTSEEALGKNIRILKSDRHLKEFYKQMWDTILSGEVWQGEVTNKRKDGSLYVANLTIAPVFSENRIAAKDSRLEGFVAIQNDITERKQAREKFARQLIDSQEQERKRIAGEMHDALGQDLIIIKNLALIGLDPRTDVSEMKTHIEEISETASHAIEDVREIARNLRPYQLDRLGLSQALESILKNIARSSEIRFSKDIDNVDGIFLPEHEIHLYRILQESINNIIKHSDALEALMIVKKENDRVILTIKDDGKGFVTKGIDSSLSQKRGFGLSGIAERVQILGGEFELKSRPGKGTTLTIILPIPKK